jgi:hypothetical protein
MQTQTHTQTQDYWTATAITATAITAMAPRTQVTLYDEDGSVYQGYVNERGEKHGQGTLKTGIYLSGIVGDDNSHLMKWSEYSGNWCNGLLHGYGVMRKMSSNGVAEVVFEGIWEDGVPKYE